MSSSEDGWGDLFAKAADIGGPAPVLDPQTQTNNVNQRCPSSHRKRKRKRGHLPNDHDSEFHIMLESRMDPNPPSSIWANASLFSQGFDSTLCCSSSVWESTIVTGPSKCKRCNELSYHHRLDFNVIVGPRIYDGQSMWPIPVFASIRNVRCCAKMIALRAPREKVRNQHVILSRLDMLMQCIFREWKEILTHGYPYLSTIPKEEGTMLEGKLNDLSGCIKALKGSIKAHSRRQKTKDGHSVFQNSIRVVIACDSSYYRMFYVQLVGMLPRTTDLKDTFLFLPHPSEYFEATLGSTVDVRKKAEKLLKSSDHTLHDILAYCNASCEFGTNTPHDHMLARIFRHRWWETIQLFFITGWSRSTEAKNLLEKELEASKIPAGELDKFETPAPKLLSDWRNSCRDFMCNIFAYATLPPKTIVDIVHLFSTLGIDQVVECGAGTGYVARLLADATKSRQDSVTAIEAWDKYPTSNARAPNGVSRGNIINEYHGRTPAFFEVKMASKDSICLVKGREKKTALLLCYPPPQSAMAYNNTKAFLEAGGSHLIHIGEFKGLTGDASFEKLILREMKCIERLPTFTWGTDASGVTIWAATTWKEDIVESRCSLLLPCSTCNEREAIKRCRLDRTLVYCSERCCKAGAEGRIRQMELRMIPMCDILFQNCKHFESLSK